MSKKFIGIIIFAILLSIGGFYYVNSKNNNPRTSDTVSTRSGESGEPNLKIETIVRGLSNVWDVAEAPDKTIFYTERANKIGVILNGKPVTISQPEGVAVRGEGGMLGMTLDPEFSNNRYLYACFNTSSDVRLARFKVSEDNKSLAERTDIITGMPANPSGRHSGCRPRFDSQQNLWVGTGDAARNQNPQSPTSLGGKILRVDRNGKAVQGNLEAPFDSRIYSYGHRNTQGLAFYRQPKNGLIGYSVEHGPNRDDELNILEKGNFGWDPGAGYDESADMTDLKKFPDSRAAIWSSGRPTIAPSGAAIIEGDKWKSWNGRLMMAAQKGEHIRLFGFDESGKKVTSQKEILSDYGRIRSLVQASDGSVLMTTDNGSGEDKIIRIVPQ